MTTIIHRPSAYAIKYCPYGATIYKQCITNIALKGRHYPA